MHVERTEVELEVLVARIDRDELHVLSYDSRGRRRDEWDEARQQRLIDTILRNWSIPSVHVDGGGPAGQEAVLDGCQRLRTIARFFHDELACSAAIPPADGTLAQLDRLRFSDLPADVRRRVRRYRLSVVTLTDHEPVELDELLDRLRAPGRADSHPVAVVTHHRRPPQHLPVDYRWLFAARPPPTLPTPRDGDTPGRAPRATGTHRVHISPEPIYDQVSSWFADLSEFQELSSGDSPSPPQWSSPADVGNAAARAAVHPEGISVTAAGLPQREPQAQLVPGAIDPPADVTPGDGRMTNPDEVSERLASHQHGVAEGRQDRYDVGYADGESHPLTPPSIFDDDQVTW